MHYNENLSDSTFSKKQQKSNKFFKHKLNSEGALHLYVERRAWNMVLSPLYKQ